MSVGRQGLLAGTAAFLVLAAEAGAAPPVPTAQESFAPPSVPLLLTRRLERSLSDGNAVVTERTYQVRIVNQGAGYRVEGELIETRVDAPPSLAALAAIERSRPDTGMFPVLLDANGLILEGSARQSDGSLGRAADFAAARISRSDQSHDDKAQAQAFIAQLRGQRAHVQWPADIFHPAPGKRSQTRILGLPDGSEGRVMIEIEGAKSAQGGQLASLTRVVTTDLNGDQRVTREAWSLLRAPASLHR